MIHSLPAEVQAVLQEFRTCEFTTVNKDGAPLTWPVSARYLPDPDRFLITTNIGFPFKALHVRRNPRVALLFSNPTASGLTDPPAVLIQGNAVCADEIVPSATGGEGLREYWRDTIFRRQPTSSQVPYNALLRKMMDWYFMRLLIYITPRAVYWWPKGDFSRPAHRSEAAHVD